MKICEDQRDECQILSEGCHGTFHIQSWWMDDLQPSNKHLLEEIIGDNEPWLFIGIPHRDPIFVTQNLERHSASLDQHVKKWMSLRESLHVMMRCYMRQHFADRYCSLFQLSPGER